MDLIVWYEPHRITHADAAARAHFVSHRSVTEFARQVEEHITGGDRVSHVRLTVKDRAVARMRYLAGKHRLVCYEPDRQVVLNPPLMRRSGAYELSFCVGHSIDDPAPSHLAAAVHALTADNWFLVLEDGDDHYVQAAITSEGYLLEVRDGSPDSHLQTRLTDAAEIVKALQAQATGDASWREAFTWQPVPTT